MKLEDTFNTFLGKELISADNPEEWLDRRLNELRERSLQLNKAREKMSQGYQQVLEGLQNAFPNLDLNDPNLKDSPGRMARALIEVCSGLGAQDSEVFSTTFPSDSYNQVIILRDIDFHSLCSHHFIPFEGRAHVGYLPETQTPKSRVVGLSKLARIVDVHAKRPQLQERMTQDIMMGIKTQLNPAGVMVVIEAKHGCLSCRGAKKSQANMITSALDGQFKESSKLRSEFLSLILKQG